MRQPNLCCLGRGAGIPSARCGFKLPDEVIEATPEIPWRQVKGMRIITAHAYHRIDYEEVWVTLRDDVPRMDKAISAGVRPKIEAHISARPWRQQVELRFAGQDRARVPARSLRRSPASRSEPNRRHGQSPGPASGLIMPNACRNLPARHHCHLYLLRSDTLTRAAGVLDS
jgi:hypothetical protein